VSGIHLISLVDLREPLVKLAIKCAENMALAPCTADSSRWSGFANRDLLRALQILLGDGLIERRHP
jgi:hypothetical protein